MRKFRKGILVAGLATSLVLGMCSSALATGSAIYVGDTGFDLNRILNDTDYETSFKSYLKQNIASGIYIDFDGNGSGVNTDDFLNSTADQTLVEFEKANETPLPVIIWSDISEP